jgi:hypothetical protein
MHFPGHRERRIRAIGFPDDLVFGLESNFTRSWRTAMTKAEITDARFHNLRVTAITT